MGSVVELKTKSNIKAYEVAIATRSVGLEEYEKLIAEWAEVVYLGLCQLSEDQKLTLDNLPLSIATEEIEVRRAA